MAYDMKGLVKRLKEVIGERWVSDDPEIRVAYSRDAAAYGRFGWRRQLPDVVVLPDNIYQVQQIIYLAREYKAPIIPYGSAMNIAGWCIPRKGGILVDVRRMNRILEINEDDLTITVEAGVPLFRAECELHKRGYFMHQPGAQSTVLFGSHFLHGKENKMTVRLNYTTEQLVGWEVVLYDGTILRTGSRADMFSLGVSSFWKHGPGPDLGDYPRYSEGIAGIVTALTIRIYPVDEHFKIIWPIFDDVDKAIAFYEDFCHSETFSGSSMYSNFKYTSYWQDCAEVVERINRIHPEIAVMITLQGTKRRVEYEEKLLRELTKKHGGRIPTDNMPFYQMFFDTHINMAGSFFSEFAMRYWTFPGTAGGPFVFVYDTPYSFPLYYRIQSKIYLEHPLTSDPDYLYAAAMRGFILYPCDGGHHAMFESMVAGQHMDPLIAAKILPETLPKMLGEVLKAGFGFDWKYVRIRRGEVGVDASYLDLLKKLLKVVDPDEIGHPAWFLSP